MTTMWTKVSNDLPEYHKKVLVYHVDGEYVDICELTTNPWSLKPCWDDGRVYCAMGRKDMWCEIPYPEKEEE